MSSSLSLSSLYEINQCDSQTKLVNNKNRFKCKYCNTILTSSGFPFLVYLLLVPYLYGLSFLC